MKKRNKKTLISLLVLTPFVVFGLFYFGLLFKVMIYDCFKMMKQQRIKLFHKTDYKVLLETCRKLMEEKRMGKWPEDMYDVRSDPHPDTKMLPKNILELSPNFIAIENNRVTIEMSGRGDYCRIFAYPEGVVGENGKKLIDGLYLYDSQYDENQDWEEYVQSYKSK